MKKPKSNSIQAGHSYVKAVKAVDKLNECLHDCERDIFEAHIRLRGIHKRIMKLKSGMESASKDIQSLMTSKPKTTKRTPGLKRSKCELCGMAPFYSKLKSFHSVSAIGAELKAVAKKGDLKVIRKIVKEHDSGPERFLLKRGMCVLCSQSGQIESVLQDMAMLRVRSVG